MKKTPSGLDLSELQKYPGYLLARARWSAFRNFERSIGRPFELRPVEFSTLIVINSNRDVSQSQLSQALGVAAPNMTGILRKLDERGLIAKAQSPTDGRVQHLGLSARGKKLLTDAVAAGKSMDREWLGRLSPGEEALLLELLAKLAEPGAPQDIPED